MSTVNNNHVKITDYLPTKAQLVRGMGYAATGTCNIAALGAAYIATIQVGKRAECMTGFALNEIPFQAEILALDMEGVHALVPTAFTAAAIGLHKLAPKIHAYTNAWAQTLEAASKRPIVMDPTSNPVVKNSSVAPTSKDEPVFVASDTFVSESESEAEIAPAKVDGPLVDYLSHSSGEEEEGTIDIKPADTQIKNSDLPESSES